MNRLYYGDCLTIMQDWPSQYVDLIYLDPPFNSNRQYNAIYRDATGRPLPDQIDAFCDMWELDAATEQAIRIVSKLMEKSGIDNDVAEFWRLWMKALRGTQPSLLAYLSYMAHRLLIMRRILKPTGSIYLHCDPTASHYVKALMDAVFGHQNFKSEVVWKRTSAHSGADRWGPIHDTILFYTKGSHHVWNRTYQEHDPSYIAKNYRHSDEHGIYRVGDLTGAGTRKGDSGQSWKGANPTQAGRHWAVPGKGLPSHFQCPDGYGHMTTQERLDVLDAAGLIHWPERGSMPGFKRYLETSPGTLVQDIILDIGPVSGDEDTGRDTQKPLALLKRIIKASSNPGDVVLDPFCGCATTLMAAHSLGRRWIGIDIAIHAIKRVAQVRLTERCGLVEGEDFTVDGVPRDLEGAQDLWERDKYHFQKWAVEQVDGFVTTRRTADGGIDGRLYFDMPGQDDLENMVLEVKGGRNVNIRDVRALRGVLDHDDALMAGLIVMHPLSTQKARNFERFMGEAGSLDILGVEYPRMQILTVSEILDGKRFHTPTVAGKHEPQPVLPYG